ncbi:hypothetical protein G5V59_07390 [Nocardioides sp. W3-2-3]|uniref:hypothetical protein n=1 Tax=Nocardioides convexus TaxID=2712224 RepID=UPI00241837EA|nr:hypothetical protein [Nocardioides convexus]NHA00068.1 hypothetical protein [Nocardioides convexus]
MTRFARLLPVALLALVLSGCSLSLQDMPKPGGLEGSTYSVTASFDDVLNLPANAEVRDGARIVGEVGSMEVDGYRARVEPALPRRGRDPARDHGGGPLRQPARRPVRRGAQAHRGRCLDRAAARGRHHRRRRHRGGAHRRGHPRGLRDHPHRWWRRRPAHDLPRNSTRSSRATSSRSARLLGRLETSARLLAGGLGPIDRALTQVGRLVKRTNDGSDVLVDGLKEIAPALKVLGDLNDDFKTLLTGLDGFAKAGNAVVARSGDQTVKALDDLVPVVRQIVDSRDLITPVLKNVRVLADQVPKVDEIRLRTGLRRRPDRLQARPPPSRAEPSGNARR